MENQEITEFIQEIPDEVLERMQFSAPWQYDSGQTATHDGDGFSSDISAFNRLSHEQLQQECWNKLHLNPQINTAVRGHAGRLAGNGFECVSYFPEINKVLRETTIDFRNRLYNFWPKYVARAYAEGELFLMLTVHADGFCEVDFVDPSNIGGTGDDGTGIIFHPTKTQMPLFYNVRYKNSAGMEDWEQIPSVFIARAPDLAKSVMKHQDYDRKRQSQSRTMSRRASFKKMGGYDRFIVGWDKGFVTRRAVSYLRTTLVWLNHYENLKKYEIDHKKSSGAYLWVFKIVDAKSYKIWLSLSDEDRKKTGIMSKKTPGGSLVLPPGMEVECKNPNLSSITDQDGDILGMATSGLNEPEDVTTGKSSGTFASVKASRGPMSDRTADEIAYFERFLKYDFWGSILYIRSVVDKSFPRTFKKREAVSFNKSQKAVFKDVEYFAEELVDINFPVSETIDVESRARGYMGVKHGPLAESLGMNNERIARQMGINGFGRMRLDKATEDETFPELEYNVDAETLQENIQSGNVPTKGDPKKTKTKTVKEKKNAKDK